MAEIKNSESDMSTQQKLSWTKRKEKKRRKRQKEQKGSTTGN